MSIIENHCKKQLDAGKLALGFGVLQSRRVDIAKIAKTCGYDWLFVDLEHSAMDLDTASQICVAALDVGITPLVRVSGHEHFHAARILDNGAMGVVVPHVDTVEEARAAVDHVKFPPIGHRSMTGGLSQVGFQNHGVAEQPKIVNAQTMVVIMLETPTAIENAEAIAAVDGVDVMLIGTNDLCAEMGIPGEFGHERVEAAYDAALAAAKKHGKHVGLGGIYDEALVAKFVEKGVRFILGGADLGFVMTAASARSSFLRSLEAN
jgi:2-keto-3-deoxy-L-rhamnonate aldolase RhmA|tara:strand:+ start:1291 stop:2079 length:789 start_codon:yes stop_codon:yes gene_type:complete